MVWPLTQVESSEARKTAMSAMSLGLADAAERGAGDYFLVEVAAEEAGGVDAFGFDHAGVEGVDANLLRPSSWASEPVIGVDGALGGAVDGAGRHAVGGYGADVDDAAAIRGEVESASWVVRSRPRTLMLNCLWKWSGVTPSMGLNS
jgi:hypothetical protein